MNPIWRVAHEMSKTRSETQKRNQRRREAAKTKRIVQTKLQQEASERERQRYMVGQENENEEDHQPSSEEESVAEKFQRELCWCIEQLEVGLVNPKATQKQKQDSERILKTLKSSRAPMAKKRQVMHSSFGDYRVKMQDEKKKLAAAMKNASVFPAGEEVEKKGQFFKKASSQQKSINPVTPCFKDLGEEKKDEETVVIATNGESHNDGKVVFKPADAEFKFEFVMDEAREECCSRGDNEEEEVEKVNEQLESRKIDVRFERTDTCQQEASIENTTLQQLEGISIVTAGNT